MKIVHTEKPALTNQYLECFIRSTSISSLVGGLLAIDANRFFFF
jgi:hypothetical protein